MTLVKINSCGCGECLKCAARVDRPRIVANISRSEEKEAKTGRNSHEEEVEAELTLGLIIQHRKTQLRIVVTATIPH